MEVSGYLCVALLATYAWGLVTPLLWVRGNASWVTTAVAVAGLAALPLLLPADQPRLRALVAFLAADVAFKLIDFRRHVATASEPMRYGDFAWSLFPIPVLLVVFTERRPRRPLYSSWRAALSGSLRIVLLLAAIALLTAGAFWLLIELSHSSLLQRNFALDQLKSVLIFILFLEALSRLLQRLERELGYDIPPLVNHAIASLTVADFWRRYNTRIHDWLYRNVFLPAGGRRNPARAVVAVFLVSGLMHEFAFAIATSRPDGYQFAFFLLQVPAVLLGEYLQPRLRRSGPFVRGGAWLITLAWFAATSMLFFHGVHRVFPCAYAGKPWLP